MKKNKKRKTKKNEGMDRIRDTLFEEMSRFTVAQMHLDLIATEKPASPGAVVALECSKKIASYLHEINIKMEQIETLKRDFMSGKPPHLP